MTEIKYPTRCKIIDAAGEYFAGYICGTPETSKPHIGKEGVASKDEHGAVVVQLDDGNILYGTECWWVPLND